MEFTQMTEDVEIIQQLGTYPNQDDDLEPDELKPKFDESAKRLKAFINDTHIPEHAASEKQIGAAFLGVSKCLEQESSARTRAIYEAKEYTDKKCSANYNQAYGDKIVLDDASDKPLQGLNIYGKTTQSGTPAPTSFVPFESVGANGNICVTDKGKNLIPFPYVTANKTQNGVTFTVQEDGGIKVTGTATATTFFNLCTVRFAEVNLNSNGVATDGNVVISGHDPDRGVYVMYTQSNNTTAIVVNANVIVDTVAYPQVEEGTVATEYEPYRPSSTITIPLDSGLPGIPVASGGNYTDANGQQWICDEVDFARNAYIKRVHTVDFSIGTWTLNTDEYPAGTGTYGHYFYKYKNPDMPKPHTTPENIACGFCNAFTYHGAVFSGNWKNLAACAYGESICFRYDAIGNDPDAMLAFLRENGVKVQYIMEEPEEIALDSVIGADQIAVYSDMETHFPYTVMENDAGAWMKVSYISADLSVKYTEQKLTEAQKEQARKNINVASTINPSAYNLPILYLYGDVSQMTAEKNEVDFSYRYKGKSGNCTMKWQGGSSLAYPKKNYTIKFDTAFEAKEGWGEQKKYCLKANYIDFSHARNVVSARLWGQMVASRTPANATLADCPNYGAIDGFPVCIVMNGEFIGVYTFNIPKDGWMMNMGSGNKECIICADNHGNASSPTRFRSEATLNGDFELEYVSDEDNADWVKTSVNNLINACIASDGTDLDTIGTMLDWESAIDYYIFLVLLRGVDMTYKNYLLSTYDGTKWFFGAYDMDSTYGLEPYGKYFLNPEQMGGGVVSTGFKDYGSSWGHRAMELIRLYKLDELKSRYAELRNSVLSEGNVSTEMLNFCAQIPKPLLDEDNRIWPGIPSTSANTVYQILNWYRMRCAKVDKEVEEL